MDRTIQSASRNYSAWIWLASFLAFAVVTEVVAVRYGDFGLAVSGVGIAVLGAFGFFAGPSFNANVRTMLRAPANVDPKVAALAGAGAFLLLVGLVVKWLG